IMKKILLGIVLIITTMFSVTGQWHGGYRDSKFEYEHLGQDNYLFKIRSFFSSGTPSSCGSFNGYRLDSGNDTLYVKALIDARFVEVQHLGCGMIDTFSHTIDMSGFSYLNMSTNLVTYHPDDSIYDRYSDVLTDTLWNVADSTFPLNNTSINEVIKDGAVT